jgi:hypothetical protein
MPQRLQLQIRSLVFCKLTLQTFLEGNCPQLLSCKMILRYATKAALVFSAATLSLIFASPVLRTVRETVMELENLAVQTASTALAVLAACLVFVVYAKLIGSTSYLSSTSLYIKEPLQNNVGHLLSVCWPDKSSDPTIELPITTERKRRRPEKDASNANDFRLLYLGRMHTDGLGDRVARGLEDCIAKRAEDPVASPLWIANGSQLNSHMVQILVWEWLSAWLMVIMVVETMLFNGLFTNQITIDTVPRITVVGIYFVAFCVHFWYVWSLGAQFYREVAAGSTWSLLERARFAVTSVAKLRSRAPTAGFVLRGISKTNAGHKIPFFNVRFNHEIGTSGAELLDTTSIGRSDQQGQQLAQMSQPLKNDLDNDEANALKVIEANEKAERETAEIAVKDARDRIASNALILLGVSISTGFTSWTAYQFTENSPNNMSANQIGSLALLASMTLGVGAMLSSAMHLSTLMNCYHQLVSLVEVKINGEAVAHHKKRKSGRTILGFTYDTVPMTPVGLKDMFKAAIQSRKLLRSLLFGPAYVMIPGKADYERKSDQADYELTVDVRGRKVLLTTRRTDSHLVLEDNMNAEALNICYLAESTNAGATSLSEKGAQMYFNVV